MNLLSCLSLTVMSIESMHAYYQTRRGEEFMLAAGQLRRGRHAKTIQGV